MTKGGGKENPGSERKGGFADLLFKLTSLKWTRDLTTVCSAGPGEGEGNPGKEE
jgi:hypothetical protein